MFLLFFHLTVVFPKSLSILGIFVQPRHIVFKQSKFGSVGRRACDYINHHKRATPRSQSDDYNYTHHRYRGDLITAS